MTRVSFLQVKKEDLFLEVCVYNYYVKKLMHLAT